MYRSALLYKTSLFTHYPKIQYSLNWIYCQMEISNGMILAPYSASKLQILLRVRSLSIAPAVIVVTFRWLSQCTQSQICDMGH